MQIAEALQVSHILHNRNVHLLHTAEASEESWIGSVYFRLAPEPKMKTQAI